MEKINPKTVTRSKVSIQGVKIDNEELFDITEKLCLQLTKYTKITPELVIILTEDIMKIEKEHWNLFTIRENEGMPYLGLMYASSDESFKTNKYLEKQLQKEINHSVISPFKAQIEGYPFHNEDVYNITLDLCRDLNQYVDIDYDTVCSVSGDVENILPYINENLHIALSDDGIPMICNDSSSDENEFSPEFNDDVRERIEKGEVTLKK